MYEICTMNLVLYYTSKISVVKGFGSLAPPFCDWPCHYQSKLHSWHYLPLDEFHFRWLQYDLSEIKQVRRFISVQFSKMEFQVFKNCLTFTSGEIPRSYLRSNSRTDDPIPRIPGYVTICRIPMMPYLIIF